MTPTLFRGDFPEFRDTDVFPDSAVNYWLNLAVLMLPSNRWGALLNTGLELFAAHNLVIEAMNQKTVAVGGLPGLSRGAISSESPGQVSITYDTANTLEEGAGHWNLTTFGTRFIFLARMIGAGPTQISAGLPCGIGFGQAWFGPNVYP